MALWPTGRCPDALLLQYVTLLGVHFGSCTSHYSRRVPLGAALIFRPLGDCEDLCQWLKRVPEISNASLGCANVGASSKGNVAEDPGGVQIALIV